MPEPIDIRSRREQPSRSTQIAAAIELARDISARARAQGSGLVCYPVEDIELILDALTGRGPA